MIEKLLNDVMKIVKRGQVPRDRRRVIAQTLVDILTEMDVVVVYYDDTYERRRNPDQPQDTPFPVE